MRKRFLKKSSKAFFQPDGKAARLFYPKVFKSPSQGFELEFLHNTVKLQKIFMFNQYIIAEALMSIVVRIYSERPFQSP